jgi:hypothetical protein
MRSYDLLVEVPIVDSPNPDGIRSANPTFQRAVEERLGRELFERGLPTLRLDRAARASWLDAVEARIWNDLRPLQLPLLDAERPDAKGPGPLQ